MEKDPTVQFMGYLTVVELILFICFNFVFFRLWMQTRQKPAAVGLHRAKHLADHGQRKGLLEVEYTGKHQGRAAAWSSAVGHKQTLGATETSHPLGSGFGLALHLFWHFKMLVGIGLCGVWSRVWVLGISVVILLATTKQLLSILSCWKRSSHLWWVFVTICVQDLITLRTGKIHDWFCFSVSPWSFLIQNSSAKILIIWKVKPWWERDTLKFSDTVLFRWGLWWFCDRVQFCWISGILSESTSFIYEFYRSPTLSGTLWSFQHKMPGKNIWRSRYSDNFLFCSATTEMLKPALKTHSSFKIFWQWL